MTIPKRVRDEAIMVLRCVSCEQRETANLAGFCREAGFSDAAYDLAYKAWLAVNHAAGRNSLRLDDAEAAALLEFDNWSPGDPVRRLP